MSVEIGGPPQRASTNRRVRWLAGPLALVMAVTLFEQPLAAEAAPKWEPPKPKEVAGLEVTDVRPKAARAAFSAESRTVRQPRSVTWPAAGTATVRPKVAGARRAGELPVTVSAVESEGFGTRGVTGPDAVSVRVFDRAATARAGVQGVLLGLGRADGRTGTGQVAVEVDFSEFAHAYGGDWASRLRLVRRPACAVSTPQLAECQTSTPVPTVNDPRESTVSAQVGLSGEAVTLLAVQADSDGDNGDYKATDLSPAGTWEVSNQTGDFSWSYELRMPPSLGGPTPSVSLAYSSGSVDGLTGMTNNQGGWVGDGWASWPGFIERRYASCADDNPGHKTGDLCWFSDNATLSLNGRAGELVRDGSVWRLKNDDGTKIERLTGSARDNGDDDNEYWKVTTTDGVQYFFGYHRLPGWSSGDPVTNSTWTAPVYGNNSGEPCYNSTFANARCDQGWRWNLDYVVDPNDNSLAYFYKKETGAYGRNNTPTQRTTYDRGGYLDRIEYGMRKGSEYSAAAPLRVMFETRERCLSECWTGTAWTSDPKPNSWPDTPWDQFCKESPCVEQGSPTFWSARRLTKVTAQLRSGTSSYRDVESWALRQEFINAGTGESTPMWLRGVTRTGHVTTAGGVAVSDPEITFNPGAEPLANRVDGPSDQRTELNRWRIKQIRTESGGDILVTYSGHDCTRGSLPTPHSNTKRCMPAYFSWPGSGDPTLDWFHKYVVTRIDLDDLVTDQPNQTTFYDYLDSPAWAYNTDELTKDKHRTWGDWRGYGRVRVRQGDPTNGVQTSVEYRYLRGMHGDKQPSGTRDVQVPDTWGGSITDHEALQGFVRQEITYNGVSSGGVNGAEVSSTLNAPWRNGPTATRTRNGVTTNAWMVNNASTRTRTAISTGGFRTTRTATTYNSDGLPTAVDDAGDENATGDETCTRTSYARNDDSWMIDRVNQSEVLSVRCQDAPSTATPATVLKRERSFYDSYTGDSSFGAAPTRGNVVRTEELDRFNGSTPVYVRTGSTSYDAYGRVTAATDARGHTTATAYTTANGGLLTQTVETNPLGHTQTTAREPAWNLATRVTDGNGVSTDLTYDGLGRLTNVWLPGRNKANQTPSTKISYLVRNSGGPTAVTTESLLVTGSTYKKSVTLYDGFLRERQTQDQATGGGRLLAETFHNARGEVEWTSEPYYDTTNAAPSSTLGTPQGQIPSITQNVYDGAGRQTAEIFKALGVEKWRTSTTHGGDRIHVTSPKGGVVSTVITDAKGQTTRLRQYKNRGDVGSTDPATYDETQYTHTLLGQQKTIKDPAGNTWSYSYDLRGREIQSVDPDKGTTNSTYDVAGNVLTVTAPLGTGTATVAYTYDELGRKTSVRDDSTTGAKRADWVYDTLPNGKGKLTSTTRYTGGQAWTSRTDSYDAFGRTTSTSLVVPSAESQLCAAAAPNPCVYTTTTSYRVNGQVHQVNLPAAADLPAERLTFGYNDLSEDGSLLSAAQIYVGAVTYNKLGQLTGRELGDYGSRVAVTSDFDEPTRRLTATNVVPELKPEAAHWSYEYDEAGNVTRIKEQPQGQTADTQCYTYDHVRRLTRAWTPGSGDCAANPTVAGLGGPAPYWHSWTFDVTGNRLTETRHAATNTTYTYTHPPAGSARPHTVTNVTATGGASWSRNYGYDNAGNTVTRPSASGATQNLVWNREGDLESVTEGGATTSFRYDTEGNRLTRTDATGKTLYLPGGLEVRYTNATAAKTATRYYTHADAVVAMRTGEGLYWILGDHHGTAEVTINAATLAVAKRRTLPYGDIRGGAVGTWPAAMDKGFVGGTKDPTGLTHIGAREYDPFIGRFISVDPVIDYADPQQMHGYAYSNNNPVSFTDPDGEFLRSFVQKAASGVASAAVKGATAVAKNAGNISLGLGVAALACSAIPPLQVAAPFLGAGAAVFSGIDAAYQWKQGKKTDAAVSLLGAIPGAKAVTQSYKLISKAGKPALTFAQKKLTHMGLSRTNAEFQRNARRAGQDESYRRLAYQMETQGMMVADWALGVQRQRVASAVDDVIGGPRTWVDTWSDAMTVENMSFTSCKWFSTCAETRHDTLFPQRTSRDVVKANSGARGTGTGGYRPKATPSKKSPSAPVRTPTYTWVPGRIGGI